MNAQKLTQITKNKITSTQRPPKRPPALLLLLLSPGAGARGGELNVIRAERSFKYAL